MSHSSDILVGNFNKIIDRKLTQFYYFFMRIIKIKLSSRIRNRFNIVNIIKINWA